MCVFQQQLLCPHLHNKAIRKDITFVPAARITRLSSFSSSTNMESIMAVNSSATPVRRRAIVKCVLPLVLLAGLVPVSWGDATENSGAAEGRLTQVSLEQLGEIEVTTASKRPVKVSQTPAAIYVVTQEDIRRSGATSIPEALRLVPGVEVARIDSNTWSLGVRGFGSALSRSVLVLIDGRSVYTPLFAGVYWQGQGTPPHGC